MKQIVSSKRSQMQIPFGMIFSIILIITFVALAVFAIAKFLDIKKCTQIGMFKEDLQESVDRAWTSDSTSETFSSSLPSGIQKICFVDLSESSRGKNKEHYSQAQLYVDKNKNMFFWPLESSCSGLKSFEIKHIDIEKVTEQENPYCVDSSGKIEMKIEKDIYDALVCVDCDNTGGGICVDRCGDSSCQEIVCLGSGCPCAESPASCPQDCP